MDDKKIIELYFSRDERALDETRAVYNGVLRSLAGRLLRDERDREEILSDTYMRAWQSIPPKQPQHLGAYLSKILRNLAIDRIRADTSGKRAADRQAAICDELAECIPDNCSPQTMAESAELFSCISLFLRNLPNTERNLFLRRYFFAASISELSKDFFKTQTNVKVTLLRTREKLRNHLQKEGFSNEA